LSSLLADIGERVGAENALDFVFFTGDVAFTGKPEEYAVAASFFRDLSQISQVSLDRTFCVPGNHDVDRARLSDFIRAAGQTLTSRDLVSEVLSPRGEHKLFTDRLHNFHAFASSLFPWASASTGNHLAYAHHRVAAGRNIGVVGLNSAWLAGSDDDRGQLLVGERQVRQALDVVTDADIVLALMHHPVAWLREFDAADVERLLSARCDFVLHGHLHETGALTVVTPDSETLYFAAGAAFSGRQQLLAYSDVSLDLAEGVVRVVIRRYSDRGGFWAPDTTAYRSTPTGEIVLELPEGLTARPASKKLLAVSARVDAVSSVALAGDVATAPLPRVPPPPLALVREIREGRCILFAGAGASRDAKLPSWEDFLRGMIETAQDAGVATSRDLEELDNLIKSGQLSVVAAFCRDELGAFEFAQYVRDRLAAPDRPSATHRLLAEIPFRAAMTTNFDSLIERAHANSEVLLPADMLRLGAPGAASLLEMPGVFPVMKLHGTARAGDSIVLTRADFRRILFDSPDYREFLRRVATDATLFFYGYSFRDQNMDFLLQELTSAHEGNTRPHYALLAEQGTIASRYWFKDLNLRVIDYRLWDGSHVAATAFLEQLAVAVGEKPPTERN
jgi:hypothetical protein